MSFDKQNGKSKMMHATQPLLGWSIAALVWLCSLAAISAVGSICLLIRTSKNRRISVENDDEPEIFARAICVFVSFLAPVPLLLSTQLVLVAAFPLAIILWGIQVWKLLDLIEMTYEREQVLSKWRTRAVVATSLVTIVCASLLAFA
jgi:hypothetical protein